MTASAASYLVSFKPDFAAWRNEARYCLAAKVRPEQIVWDDGTSPQTNLFAAALPEPHASEPIRIPKSFFDLAEYAATIRSEDRWDLLYRIAFRCAFEQPQLVALASDPDVAVLYERARAVRRDRHKMTAFVRFRSIVTDGRERFVAFHRPDHLILRHIASFFTERFAIQDWSILTPDGSLHWTDKKLTFGPPATVAGLPGEDDIEPLWLDYYASIFNPARLNINCMKREMPVKHWNTLPEAALIADLSKQARSRVKQMTDANTGYTLAPVPATRSLDMLRDAAAGCRACPHACRATGTVFGIGRPDATMVLVGEQPGDMEDREGTPFIGPAGNVLRELMALVSIDRNDVYLTNAVKHFKFEERGERRIHQKPSARDESTCRPWLEAELSIIEPKTIVCLGATAMRQLLGPTAKLTQIRGEVIEHGAAKLIVTYHPSAVLRAATREASDGIRAMLHEDLRLAASVTTW